MENYLLDALEKHIDKKTAKLLETSIGVESVFDLLRYFPRKYFFKGELSNINKLVLDEQVTVLAKVLSCREKKFRRGNLKTLEVNISDGVSVMTATFFNQLWRKKELIPGTLCLFAGKVSNYNNRFQLSNPEYKVISNDRQENNAQDVVNNWVNEPISLYQSNSSVSSWKISKTINAILKKIDIFDIPDVIEKTALSRHSLFSLKNSFIGIHKPADEVQLKKSIFSMKVYEAIFLLNMVKQKREIISLEESISYPIRDSSFIESFDAKLPFSLTLDQIRIGETISKDLFSRKPMNRLLHGEVGTGKTLVALRAMLQIAQNDAQSVLIAPTEVLAKQHFDSINKMLLSHLQEKIKPILFIGSQKDKIKKQNLKIIFNGESKIIIGTHALFSNKIKFSELGLVVIDEQHRFGVEQRFSIHRNVEYTPNTLVLSATPIPRSVAMTVFGALDVSKMSLQPQGRARVLSFVVPIKNKPKWENRVWERIIEEIEKGRQVYIVGTNIDQENFGNNLLSVYELYEKIIQDARFSNFSVGIVHGKQSYEERIETMSSFSSGEIDILIATTVIEVGVNVPNASLIVVWGADRFGISTLHQLRGRVGRGEHEGLCLLVTAVEDDSQAMRRLKIVASCNDGFKLAEEDLKIRKEGDILGNNQSGYKKTLNFLRISEEENIIDLANEILKNIYLKDNDKIMLNNAMSWFFADNDLDQIIKS